MNQLIYFILVFIIAVAGTFFVFRALLEKKISDLDSTVASLKSSFSTLQDPELVKSDSNSGILSKLTNINKQLLKIQTPQTETNEDISKDSEKSDKSLETRKSLENLQVVNELGQRVTASLSLNDVFTHLYKTINSMMDAAVFELGIYFWKDNRWQIFSNINLDGDTKSVAEEYKNHMAEWCLKNNREILLDDAEIEFGRYVFGPLVLPDGKVAQSVISFPIFQNEKERGALSVISFRKNAFNNYHIEMIRSLLPYVAVALDNALVHQELIITQNQLIHNEKMASIGQLSSGIAHEILNPLNFVNNFSEISIELLNEYQNSNSNVEQEDLKNQLVGNLDKINFHGNRAYSIVKNMMQLSRLGDGEKSKVFINKNIENTLNIAYEGFKLKYKGFECKIERILDSNVTVKKMVAEDFTRVMINVFSNAFYAMNEQLKKNTKLQQKENLYSYEPELKVKTSLVNSKIIITVYDNGSGVPYEIKDKIFLPFFTTKPTGEGTGLGLSLSHDIITKGNQGEITVQSEPGKWTEFKIELPVT